MNEAELSVGFLSNKHIFYHSSLVVFELLFRLLILLQNMYVCVGAGGVVKLILAADYKSFYIPGLLVYRDLLTVI